MSTVHADYRCKWLHVLYLFILHYSLPVAWMTVDWTLYRRITYQESSQTFGVISMRMDIQDSNGAAPARPSASTLAQNISSSGSGTKLMMTSSGTGSNSLTEHMFGEEVEVSSLLVLDQHTFEGTKIVLFMCLMIGNFLFWNLDNYHALWNEQTLSAPLQNCCPAAVQWCGIVFGRPCNFIY